MKVHTSNYAIEGFTAAARRGRARRRSRTQRGLPLVVDLGSGTLVDLERYGLPHEPTPCEALAAGARPRHLQRRQAAGRPAGGHRRRTARAGRAHAQESDEARAARGQDDARRAGGGAAALPRSRAAAAAPADAAPADAASRRHRGTARDRLRPALQAWCGDEAEVSVRRVREPDRQRLAAGGPAAERGAAHRAPAKVAPCRHRARVPRAAGAGDRPHARGRGRGSTCAASRTTTAFVAQLEPAAGCDRRHRRPRRPRQDLAGARAHRRRHRPAAGGEAPRHLHRPRLRLPAAAMARRSASSTCPATSASSATCWPASRGIDLALLVVAADDGPMPQTREHLHDPRPPRRAAAPRGAHQGRPRAAGARGRGRSGSCAPSCRRRDPAGLFRHGRGRGGAPVAARSDCRGRRAALDGAAFSPARRSRLRARRPRAGRDRHGGLGLDRPRGRGPGDARGAQGARAQPAREQRRRTARERRPTLRAGASGRGAG